MKVTREEGDRRMIVLADYLHDHVAKLTSALFDMSIWAQKKYGTVRPKVGDCGTAACALGWATTIPEFESAGLHLFVFTDGIGGFESEPRLKKFPAGDNDPFGVAAKFFDIPYGDASKLFYPAKGHQTALEVSENLRKYVQSGTLPGSDL